MASRKKASWKKGQWKKGQFEKRLVEKRLIEKRLIGKKANQKKASGKKVKWKKISGKRLIRVSMVDKVNVEMTLSSYTVYVTHQIEWSKVRKVVFPSLSPDKNNQSCF